jgi:ribA/ribD-fused uncharacterized protein
MIKLNGSSIKVPEVTITKVKEPGGCFSLMSPHPVICNGIEFRTAEALFQWLRFSAHPDVQKVILEQKSPMGAKMKARLNRALLNRGDKWDESQDDIPRMKICLQLKIEQHPDLKKLLIDTGSATIIEDCTTHDRESARFWGAVKVDGKWVGKNILGKLWMEVRNEIDVSEE